MLDLEVFGPSKSVRLTVWVDTAFTGGLAIPSQTIRRLGLVGEGDVGARLADGAESAVPVYTAAVQWFGAAWKVEVVRAEVATTLLGVQLLLTRRLTVDYAERTIEVIWSWCCLIGFRGLNQFRVRKSRCDDWPEALLAEQCRLPPPRARR